MIISPPVWSKITLFLNLVLPTLSCRLLCTWSLTDSFVIGVSVEVWLWPSFKCGSTVTCCHCSAWGQIFKEWQQTVTVSQLFNMYSIGLHTLQYVHTHTHPHWLFTQAFWIGGCMCHAAELVEFMWPVVINMWRNAGDLPWTSVQRVFIFGEVSSQPLSFTD